MIRAYMRRTSRGGYKTSRGLIAPDTWDIVIRDYSGGGKGVIIAYRLGLSSSLIPWSATERLAREFGVWPGDQVWYQNRPGEGWTNYFSGEQTLNPVSEVAA